ncbi:MAG: hypothetical protein FWH22_04020 [Fibromonadales bacterium]|nr:hypothetical protein [Fibromonadales bacterium]
MPVSIQQIEKLLLGKYAFSHLNFSMMLMRQKMSYVSDPSPAMLQNCAKEICNFLDKFKTAMGADYALIEKL